ncbi:MAG: hypothetical protein QOG17_3552, partial [Gammaproteobacteria bacterium]|nr:hypothetical protein [Gammaproteobacteria bacterium]
MNIVGNMMTEPAFPFAAPSPLLGDSEA